MQRVIDADQAETGQDLDIFHVVVAPSGFVPDGVAVEIAGQARFFLTQEISVFVSERRSGPSWCLRVEPALAFCARAASRLISDGPSIYTGAMYLRV